MLLTRPLTNKLDVEDESIFSAGAILPLVTSAQFRERGRNKRYTGKLAY